MISPSEVRGYSVVVVILDEFPFHQDSTMAQVIADIQTAHDSCFPSKREPKDLEDELMQETEWLAEQRRELAHEARRLARVHRPIWKGFPIRRRNRNLHIQ